MVLMVKFMIKEMYSCDAGSIQIQCGNSYIRFNNEYGDGTFKTYLFDSMDEFENYKKDHFDYPGMQEKDYHFHGIHFFENAKVLNYDCFEPDRNNCYGLEKETLFTIDGKCWIFVNKGKIYFVKDGSSIKDSSLIKNNIV